MPSKHNDEKMTIKKRDNIKYNYEIKPEVVILAPKEDLWNFLSDLENWWVKSNPEHLSLVVHNSKNSIGIGTKLTVREKIAGIPCKAIGEITKYDKYHLVEWKAKYYVLGVKWIKIDAGVRWKLRSNNNKSTLMANVWANFPKTFGYRLLWFIFKTVDGVKKDYDHAMRELIYIKTTIEKNQITIAGQVGKGDSNA